MLLYQGQIVLVKTKIDLFFTIGEKRNLCFGGYDNNNNTSNCIVMTFFAIINNEHASS